jgi:hypothetical protein
MPHQFPEVGSILHLPEALEMYPDHKIEIYSRVSSWGQAGPSQIRLKEKTEAVANEVGSLAPGKLRRIVQDIGEGRLTIPRSKLMDAARYAKRKNCILVASDLSRFVRSVNYSRTKNRHAWPTKEEFERLAKLTLGVPLATVESPFLTEDERHSQATRRTGKAGRPRSIVDSELQEVFDSLGCLHLNCDGHWRWETPIRTVAEKFNLSPAAIVRASERVCSDGLTWRDKAIRKAEARGLLRIEDSGDIDILVSGPIPTRGWWGRRGRPPKWAVKGRH